MMYQNDSKKNLMKKINEVSFAIDDMLLFLDTHSQDERALSYCNEMVARRRQLLREYAEKYGPLTIDCTDMSSDTTWKWAKQPFPWEQEGGCR